MYKLSIANYYSEVNKSIANNRKQYKKNEEYEAADTALCEREWLVTEAPELPDGVGEGALELRGMLTRYRFYEKDNSKNKLTRHKTKSSQYFQMTSIKSI